MFKNSLKSGSLSAADNTQGNLWYDGKGRVWQRWNYDTNIEEWSESLKRFVYDGNALVQEHSWTATVAFEEWQYTYVDINRDYLRHPAGLRQREGTAASNTDYFLQTDEAALEYKIERDPTSATADRTERSASLDQIAGGSFTSGLSNLATSGDYIEMYGDASTGFDAVVQGRKEHYLAGIMVIVSSRALAQNAQELLDTLSPDIINLPGKLFFENNGNDSNPWPHFELRDCRPWYSGPLGEWWRNLDHPIYNFLKAWCCCAHDFEIRRQSGSSTYRECFSMMSDAHLPAGAWRTDDEPPVLCRFECTCSTRWSQQIKIPIDPCTEDEPIPNQPECKTYVAYRFSWSHDNCRTRLIESDPPGKEGKCTAVKYYLANKYCDQMEAESCQEVVVPCEVGPWDDPLTPEEKLYLEMLKWWFESGIQPAWPDNPCQTLSPEETAIRHLH